MTVIVGYDGRPAGHDALMLGVSLARGLETRLLVAGVYPSAHPVRALPVAEMRARSERAVGEGVAQVGDQIEADETVVAARSAARGLHDLAEAEAASAIVIGSSHRGAIGRVLAGNVAAQLFSGSPCAVAIAPRGFAGRGVAPLQSIGVAFDDGPESWNGLQRAAELAVATGASLRIIHALEPLTAPPVALDEAKRLASDWRAHSERAVERALASLSKGIRAETRLVVGAPVRVLETEGHQGLDLLVLGSRGFGPLKRVLLGSVSAELVRLAPCPLMVVPRSVTFDPSAGGLAGRDDLGAA